MSLDFEITRQFQRGIKTTIAKFSSEADALEFMEAKVAWDHKTKVHTIYRLYQLGELLQEIDSMEDETIERDAGNSGKGSGKVFNPTPLATSPKPPGSVPYRQRDEDDIDDV